MADPAERRLWVITALRLGAVGLMAVGYGEAAGGHGPAGALLALAGALGLVLGPWALKRRWR
ncbi:MAG: hypothetical protein RMK78_03555 [Thermaurantiacus sp.]|uniref:hypothetical protein n=1 Tax=Thermaurantiacus sp. TaxID=2820283 RepID=UPI00298F061F|nr:hypothetical protein [Thermaurantiacus sp.]MDW8414531.1 hypothetical protein [Thermaurantiacus sp.]